MHWLSAYVNKHVGAIEIHQSLKWLSESDIGLLRRFVDCINQPEVAALLNDVPLRAAHRDLHFGNIMVNPESLDITGILDWEFAQVVPFPLWRRSFLWNAKHDAESYAETEKQYAKWKEIVESTEDGKRMLEGAEWKSPRQEAAWNVCNYLRCIVEVCPRGQKEKESRQWWQVVLKNLAVFDIDQT